VGPSAGEDPDEGGDGTAAAVGALPLADEVAALAVSVRMVTGFIHDAWCRA